MDSDDRALLEASLAGAVAADGGADTTDAALTQLGWDDMLATEPVTATAVVFERLGRVGARSGALDDVVAHHLGLPTGTAVVHPPWGAGRPSGVRNGRRLDGEGTSGARRRTVDRAHVLLADGVAAVAAEALEPISSGADQDHARVILDGAQIVEWMPVAPETMARAVAGARLAIGHQLHGIAESMLRLARDHAVDRIQFGRPIASFQAVRHRLAETLVAVEAAAAALAVADDEPSPLTADLARIVAGRAALAAARHGQQVLAGIGFTRDHDFHGYLFASLELDGLYGTTPSLVRDVGRALLRHRDIPRVIDL
ncbi:MAG: acyl-CoA dehydrogenase family protein [Acidimicrobiia bacterium]|nr:acyl-CoA dehydrogenase family protein [Acidimicrobiia bacterium]